MREVFAIDGTLYKYMMKLYDLIVLNLLFIITCLPIFTIGASLVALYDVTYKMQTGDEQKVFKSFWVSFKKNWQQATAIWLLFLLLLFGEFLVISAVHGLSVILLPLLFLTVVAVITLVYGFSLVSKFKNNVGAMLRNALMLAIHHAPYSILMLLIAGIICLYLPIYQKWTGILIIFLGFSTTAYSQNYFIRKILTPLISK